MGKNTWKKWLAGFLTFILCLPPMLMGAQAAYTPRLTAPASGDWHYYSNANIFYASGFGMPNCTAYAYGRAYELLGTAPRVSSGNAGRWWSYNIQTGAYGYGSTPALGAIACWDNYDNNTGHVAVVEKIENGLVTISQSNWGGAIFETRTIAADKIDSYFDSPSHFQGYIYVCGNQTEPPAEQPVDLGADFYAYIINTKHWKHATNDGKNVDSRTETGRSNQVWRFQRQPDGSYKIISAYDGRCLDVTGAAAAPYTNVGVYDDNGNDAQRWYIYGSPGVYVLKPKCSDCVLDLNENSGEEGANLQIYPRNNSDAQFFAVWNVDMSPPVLSVSGGQNGAPVSFSWSRSFGITDYDVKIWNGTYWVGEAYHIEWNVYGTEYAASLPAGYYEAYVDADNFFGSRMSNVVSFTVTAPPAVKGDLTGDGAVNVSDVMAACKIIARQAAGSPPTEEEKAGGDLNGDGNITITDVMLLCKILASRS